MQADLTRAETLGPAVDGIDAVVLTHGSHGGAEQAELVDYGAVRNIIDALDGSPVRIALMTTIGVTRRSTGHHAKRRGERLVRATGWPDPDGAVDGVRDRENQPLDGEPAEERQRLEQVVASRG